MKTETHTIHCGDGTHVVKLDIFRMDQVEAIDVYGLPADLYASGGYRIDGFINGTPVGTRFYSGNLGSHYWGAESDNVAREFLAAARRTGILPKGAETAPPKTNTPSPRC